MIYGYARVSSAGQAIDGNSLEAQSELLKANGAQKIFSDVYTGTKLHRPELDKLMAEIQPGDTLIVAKLDRIARSVKGGIEIIDSLLAKDVSVNILNMGLMNNTSTGKLIRNVMLAFAEFERDMTHHYALKFSDGSGFTWDGMHQCGMSGAGVDEPLEFPINIIFLSKPKWAETVSLDVS